MITREAQGLMDMLNDKDFRRLVAEELASPKPEPGIRAVRLVTTMLIRKGIRRDQAELYASVYIVGLFFGAGILKMSGER